MRLQWCIDWRISHSLGWRRLVTKCGETNGRTQWSGGGKFAFKWEQLLKSYRPEDVTKSSVWRKIRRVGVRGVLSWNREGGKLLYRNWPTLLQITRRVYRGNWYRELPPSLDLMPLSRLSPPEEKAGKRERKRERKERESERGKRERERERETQPTPSECNFTESCVAWRCSLI